MEIHFSHVLGTAWISASSEKFQKHLTLKCLCFLIFFPYYGNSLFPYFGNCMDFCFTQILRNFRMFVVFSPILFPYYGNPLFSCVGNCMDFCFQQNFPETFNFEMLMFSHIFSLLCEFTSLIFWELYVLMPHMKYVRNP